MKEGVKMKNSNHLDLMMALVETNKRNREKKERLQDEVLTMRRLTVFDCQKNYFMCRLDSKKAIVEKKQVNLIDLSSDKATKFFARSHLEAQHEALKWCTSKDWFLFR